MVANIPEHLDIIRAELADRYRPGDIVHLHHAEQAVVLHDLQFPRAVETAHWRNVGLRDHIIYPSRSLQEEVGRHGIVIPHGVDLDMFHWQDNEDAREDFIFYAGRVTRDKGVHLASAACKAAGVTFKVAGPCPDAGYAEQVLADTEYLGELTHDALRNMYNRARATIYLTQYNEPFGLSVVESLACGCPVITTGLGGTGEIIQQGRTGFICSTHEELVQAITTLDSIDTADCLARAGEYSIENMTDAVIDYYRASYA
jgi:glycosyltransferase involved in cell wall biosynthesis